ncbi:hypothetical protein E2C01_092924 [Portunus trituberculatus]|uniref:Uncharacterized protein n=1 Tax=Portunus trituberculatus TaxID=210409 RepID=A0A5B7JZ79_PORTR|nr:hypothetical protein [Portunus trituberculatus]
MSSVCLPQGMVSLDRIPRPRVLSVESPCASGNVFFDKCLLSLVKCLSARVTVFFLTSLIFRTETEKEE